MGELNEYADNDWADLGIGIGVDSVGDDGNSTDTAELYCKL